ncbi:hypothetical protein [Streptomyces sp. NPDC101455]|uniref:hypothetical protein n=1 Tax=Streptomyces sp. NPDC101455 TaxID=3366142 RepID=UPI0038216861
MAGRDDLIAVVHPGAPESRYAEFYPALAEGRFAPENLLVGTPDPARIDPRAYMDRCAHPAFAGATCHEAAHAAHTQFAPTAKDDPKAVKWATILEEPRIEHQLLKRRAGDRIFLRSSARHVLLDGASGEHTEESVAAAVHQAILVLGRAAAGVFDEDEVKPLASQIERIVGADVLNELHSIFDWLFDLEDGDQHGLLALGGRVAELAQDDAEEEQTSGRGSATGGSESGGGGAGTGDQSGTANGNSGGQSTAGGAGDAIAVLLPCGSYTQGDLPEDRPKKAEGGAGPQEGATADQAQPGLSVADVLVAAIAEAAVREARAKTVVLLPPRPDATGRQAAHKAAQQVFPSAGVGAAPIEVTQATPDDDALRYARVLLRSLSKAQYRDVHRTTRPEFAPPGRMIMRDVVRRSAQIAARSEITAKPWQRTTRRQADNPPLTVGISLDVSGSMDAWTGPVAATGWALADSVSSPALAGRIAAVAWNGAASPLIAPGRRPRTIPVPKAGGGSNGCPNSLYALDGALNLTGQEGARAVVVITDGALPNQDAIQKAVDHLTRAGVLVLWALVNPRGWTPKGARREYLSDPAKFGQLVGEALAKALSAA